MNTVEIVEDIVRPIADEKGFRVVDIEYVKEGKNWFLRIYIDKPGGVDLNDCAMFNELVSEQMDAIEPDPIPYAYYLEVSSPGAERPLKTEDDFDKKNVSMMVEDHKDDVEDFQDAADKLDDGDIKTFAINTLPTLQKHKMAIEEIHNKMK